MNRATICLAGLAPNKVYEASSPRLIEELSLHRPTTDLDDTWEYNPDTQFQCLHSSTVVDNHPTVNPDYNYCRFPKIRRVL